MATQQAKKETKKLGKCNEISDKLFERLLNFGMSMETINNALTVVATDEAINRYIDSGYSEEEILTNLVETIFNSL